jgi:hypothetical protein
MKYLLFILLSVFTGWCSQLSNKNTESPLANVGNSYLYPSDIKGLIKPGLSRQDSSMISKSLVEKWVRKQLIVQKAELNLTDEEKDFIKELDEYRTSLIIFKYEQKLIKEKLDTIVTNAEIEKYYKQNSDNFILSYDIVKAHFIKLPISAPNINKLREWIQTETADNMKLLEGYCFQYAVKHDYFNDQWVNFENIRMMLPLSLNSNIQPANKLIEVRDSSYIYLINMKEHQIKGSISPYSYIENDVKSIILLKRKQRLLNDLENRIYFDALNHNNFTIFNTKK